MITLLETQVRPPRVSMFGFEIDPLSLDQAVEQIYEWTTWRTTRSRFVVTPNVDHAVMYQEQPALRAAYAHASLVLADGMPVIAAARLLGLPIPERVAGSDLVPELFERAADHGGLRVFLLGAAPGVASRAAERIEHLWPSVEVVDTYSPPLGFQHDAHENETILAKIARARPEVLIVGFGAPKQELWVDAHRDRIEAAVSLCVGATIDFLAGERRRAPVWMRKSGLEWLHRMLSEPKRLVRRYARDAWLFPRLVFHEWQQARGKRGREAALPG